LNRENLKIIDTINASESKFEQLTFTDVGYPIDDMKIRICDENDRELDENIVGNIQLKSPCIMKGYYMNDKATQEAFTDDKWLKTGDTGFISNKLLVITGRKNDIMFINGKNYYPNDFENLVETLDDVQKGSVVVSSVSNDTKKEEIILFIVNDDEEKFIKLSKKIKKFINLKVGIELKDIVPISVIPKTNSGKIQRYKLVNDYIEGKISSCANSQERDSKKNYIFNKNFSNIECEVHQICCEEINNYELKITDNLFESGCNSLKAATIVAKINSKFDVKINLSDIFEIATIKEICRLVEKIEKVNTKRITPYEEQEYYPLSSQQKRMYSLNYMNPENTNYNLPVAMLITGKLNIVNFENAFLELIKRHDSLRTSFHLNNGEPVQIVNNKFSFKVSCNSVKDINITDIVKNFIKPFNLSKAPLLRVSLFSTGENKHLFLIDMHHIITDGTSMGIIIKEFAALYQRKQLSNVSFQYKDYALWQNEMLNLNRFQSQKKYWKNVFEDKIPQINIPLDYERPSLQSFDGNKVKFMVKKNLVEKIQTLAVETSTTNYMILMAAYSILISKYSSREDIVIGSPISCRSRIEFSNVIGMFVNTIALRSFPKSSKKFKNYLFEVKEICLNAYENQDYQFDWLIKEIGIKKDPARNPIFDVMYNMQNMEIPEFNIAQLHIEPVEIEDKNTRFDIILVVNEKKSKICFEIIYCTKLYKKETIEKMGTHFLNILEAIISLPNIRLSDICMLTDKEQKSLSKEMLNKIHKVNISFDI
jgi:acyl carrier protein